MGLPGPYLDADEGALLSIEDGANLLLDPSTTYKVDALGVFVRSDNLDLFNRSVTSFYVAGAENGM